MTIEMVQAINQHLADYEIPTRIISEHTIIILRFGHLSIKVEQNSATITATDFLTKRIDLNDPGSLEQILIIITTLLND